MFDEKNSQSTVDTNNIALVSVNNSFNSKNMDSAIENLNIVIGWDIVHSNHLKYSGKLFGGCFIVLFLMDLSHK